MANVRFYIAGGPGSGLEIQPLSDTERFKYIGFYASSGAGDFVTVGESQDLTWLSDPSGFIDGAIAGSGKMVNNKWVDASGVSIDGASREPLSGVRESGEATIRIAVESTSGIWVHNPRLYAYNGTSVDSDSDDVFVLSYEIIPQGTSGIGDNEWAVTDSTNYNQFVDRASGVGYTSGLEHNFYVGLAIRPKAASTSGHRIFGLRFECDVTDIPA